MPPLLSLENFNSIIDLIYSTTFDPTLWRAALAAIQNALGGCGALLGIDIDGTPRLFEFTGYDSEAMESFARTYASKSFVWGLFASAGEGVLLHDREVLAREQRRHDVFANEWARRYDTTDCVVLSLLKREDTTAFAVFARSPGCGMFEEHQQELIRRLLPHLQRAVRIRVELDRAEFRSKLNAEVVEKVRECVIVVRRDATIEYANPAARQLLASTASGLVGKRARLEARDADINVALHRLIGRATDGASGRRTGGTLLVPDEGASHPLTLFCVPFAEQRFWLSDARGTAMLFIVDPSRRNLPSESTLASLFGLTTAEARLASHLGGGATLAQTANELGVARATVASQLQAVFSKTGTHRQSDLVGLLNAFPMISTCGK